MAQDQRVLMKLEVLKGETLAELNRLFRLKVQLKEQVDENEITIHFKRGVMAAFDEFQKIDIEIAEGDKLEELREARSQASSLIEDVSTETQVATDDGKGILSAIKVSSVNRAVDRPKEKLS